MKEATPNQKQMLAYRLYKVILNSTKENLKTVKGLKETILYKCTKIIKCGKRPGSS